MHVFLDVFTLDQVHVGSPVIGNKVEFLKEGVMLEAKFYGQNVFEVELPPFLELMVVKVEDLAPTSPMAATSRLATLETGAKIEVPMFIESGDVVRVDTIKNEYVQRI